MLLLGLYVKAYLKHEYHSKLLGLMVGIQILVANILFLKSIGLLDHMVGVQILMATYFGEGRQGFNLVDQKVWVQILMATIIKWRSTGI